jgi:hypothetical protein
MGDRVASDPRRAVLDAFDLGRKEVHRRKPMTPTTNRSLVHSKFERFADLLDPSVVHHQDAVCKRHRFDLNRPMLP